MTLIFTIDWKIVINLFCVIISFGRQCLWAKRDFELDMESIVKVSEFSQHNPQYAFDFTRQVRDQLRVYDGATLDQFPIELEPEHPYQPGSRGRPNLNQTLAHSQCATCLRVLRNDLFYTLPSMMKRNMVFSHCRECNQQHNADRYDLKVDVVRARRVVIWQALAPRCSVCGFDRHYSAMDLHHPEQRENQVADLVTQVTLSLDAGKIESLLRDAAKCVPLCSNCHRMFHAGEITLPNQGSKPPVRIGDFIARLKSCS